MRKSAMLMNQVWVFLAQGLIAWASSTVHIGSEAS